jgi:hypothetical protein
VYCVNGSSWNIRVGMSIESSDQPNAGGELMSSQNVVRRH